MQTTIFDVLYEQYKITKPIRLIELFAGYGSQHFSLKYLGANVESWRIVEWAVPSIQAYNDAHVRNYNDYTGNMFDEYIYNQLFNLGISSNYNEPMTYEKIKRKGITWCKKVLNNIIVTNNLVNIQNVKGKDLKIIDTDKYDYIMTYSFPCQDLSLAGLGKGMDKDSGTRSGMLWEVERILDEIANNGGELPQILLMENVPQVIGTENVGNFNNWQHKLESLGYKNYHQNLIATDYGVPQTRNRTFMISILGNYSYTFPNPIPLKLKLKDMLEKNVDERYYLSGDILKHIKDTSKETANFTQYDRYNGQFESLCRIWKELSPTIHTKSNEIKIYDNNKIRNMTPLEVFRLMGVKDEDYERIAKNQSDSSLYHLAGDSIVVNVLMAIFKELL